MRFFGEKSCYLNSTIILEVYLLVPIDMRCMWDFVVKKNIASLMSI